MKNAEQKSVSNKSKIVILILVLAVVIAAVAIIIVLHNKNGKDDQGLYDAYSMKISSGEHEPTKFRITFDKSAKTYREQLSVSKESSVISQGTFEEDKNAVKIISDDKKTTQQLAIDGKNLVATDYLYDGKIPDGKTFDATCKRTVKDGGTYTMVFKKDGTFTYDEGGNMSKGTYERKDNMIIWTKDNEENAKEENEKDKGTIDFLIYEDQITNAYYIAD